MFPQVEYKAISSGDYHLPYWEEESGFWYKKLGIFTRTNTNYVIILWKVLNLKSNNFRGSPHAIGNLVGIESLDLSCNQLIGVIPQSLTELTFLAFLNLSQNHLVGRIPQGKQFNTFEGNSFGGNLKLCGFPLPEKCEHPHEPQLEDDEETESGFTWSGDVGIWLWDTTWISDSIYYVVPKMVHCNC